jgi:hypothetical protein
MRLPARAALPASCLVSALLGALIGGSFMRPSREAHADSVSIPKNINAESFVVVDAKGNKRGSFEVQKDGVPMLTLVDENHKNRVQIGLNPSGSGYLTFVDRAEKPVLILSVQPDGPGQILLHTPGKPGGVELSVDQGRAKAVVNDHDLTPR